MRWAKFVEDFSSFLGCIIAQITRIQADRWHQVLILALSEHGRSGYHGLRCSLVKGSRGEDVGWIEEFKNLRAIVMGFVCRLDRLCCRILSRTRLGLLAENIEYAVVETKKLRVEVEVRLNRIIERATGVVVPGSVRILHIRHVRRDYTFFWRTEVGIGR